MLYYAILCYTMLYYTMLQVKSADNRTTALHYVAKLTASADDGQIEALLEQRSRLERAKDFVVGEKKAELAKLSKNFKQVQQEREASKEGDPFVAKLASFVSLYEQGIKELEVSFVTSVSAGKVGEQMRRRAAVTQRT